MPFDRYPDHFIKRGEKDPDFQVQLVDHLGVPVPLGAATVKFYMRGLWTEPASTPKVNGAVVAVVSASTGIVKYVWDVADTDTVGIYMAEFEVDFGGGSTVSYPVDGKLFVSVTRDVS